MTLGEEDDEVVGMITMTGAPDETVMVVSQNGYGKRSPLDDYRVTNRGGKGVKTLNVTDKTGKLVSIKNVNDSNDLMIINQSGITLRLAVAGIRVMGRATQGVKLIDLNKRGDKIASVCKVDSDPGEEVEEELRKDANLFDSPTLEKSDEALAEELRETDKIEAEMEREIEDNEIEDDPSTLEE